MELIQNMPQSLKDAYCESHRCYHTLQHIIQCLKLLDKTELQNDERRILTWAIWWHDAIYDPRSNRNEEGSAELAVVDLELMGSSTEDQDEVARLILLTKRHEVALDDRLGSLLVSIDLSILGATPEEYDNYSRAVREEYKHVPDDMWRKGRPAVLQHFLDSTVIFPDVLLRAQFESQARSNIEREIFNLSQ